MEKPSALIVVDFVLIVLIFASPMPLLSIASRNFRENGVQSNSFSATRITASSSNANNPNFVCISIILDQDLIFC